MGREYTEASQTEGAQEPTLSKDLDLMDESTPPRQLNINRACVDEALVAAAAARVQRDLQLAVVPRKRWRR